MNETPSSARLQAIMALMLGANSEEELAAARVRAKYILQMSDEEVAELEDGGEKPSRNARSPLARQYSRLAQQALRSGDRHSARIYQRQALQYAAEDWTQKEGPRGGKQWVHKDTLKVKYGDKNPGEGSGRGKKKEGDAGAAGAGGQPPKEKTPKEPKPKTPKAPKPKKEKPTVDGLAAKFDALKTAEITNETVKEIADALTSLTIPQLKELMPKIGMDAASVKRARKDAIVEAIVEKAKASENAGDSRDATAPEKADQETNGVGSEPEQATPEVAQFEQAGKVLDGLRKLWPGKSQDDIIALMRDPKKLKAEFDALAKGATAQQSGGQGGTVVQPKQPHPPQEKKPRRQNPGAIAADVEALSDEVKHTYENAAQKSITLDVINALRPKLSSLGKADLVKVAEGVGLVGMHNKSKGAIVDSIVWHVQARKEATQRARFVERENLEAKRGKSLRYRHLAHQALRHGDRASARIYLRQADESLRYSWRKGDPVPGREGFFRWHGENGDKGTRIQKIEPGSSGRGKGTNAGAGEQPPKEKTPKEPKPKTEPKPKNPKAPKKEKPTAESVKSRLQSLNMADVTQEVVQEITEQLDSLTLSEIRATFADEVKGMSKAKKSALVEAIIAKAKSSQHSPAPQATNAAAAMTEDQRELVDGLQQMFPGKSGKEVLATLQQWRATAEAKGNAPPVKKPTESKPPKPPRPKEQVAPLPPASPQVEAFGNKIAELRESSTLTREEVEGLVPELRLLKKEDLVRISQRIGLVGMHAKAREKIITDITNSVFARTLATKRAGLV